MVRTAGSLLILVAFASPTAIAQQEEDVHFVLLGKTRNYRQYEDGSLKFLNTVFFGEIFLTEGGTVTNASVTGPGDAARGLSFGNERVPFLAGNRHTSIDALEEDYPEGTYYFSFDTPHGDIRDLPVTFSKPEDQSRYPAPIEITLQQGGRVVEPEAIDPYQDLRVTWSEFERGAADPNGIIDDMVYVIVGNCFGRKIVHSGPAFESPSLTYVAEEFTIPKESLHAGQPYQVEVEFSEMDTDRPMGLVSIVTYATSTFLDIRTTGTNVDNVACPILPFAMDGGQTDRSKP
jgi:hypothetical protein